MIDEEGERLRSPPKQNRQTVDKIRIEQASALLSAMANAKRLEMLVVLSKGELPVVVLAGRIGLSPSAVSQHLTKLRSYGLVQTRREAQTIYYSCRTRAVRVILEGLEEIYASPRPLEIGAS